ncbi:RHS repeat-associated core domain-containing protein [Candidatus Protochlamydia phocaeensis]|uniref:RHS repeat-associated core domain-containing protein n=1 Tax=Candidatus Protochlamydia phocaeensis TaxID=1414722 RepID=UPI0008380C08|nr:RHS repeat-associated core domain-containing protein [Candidatus Protochlamydia phocaeensis]
MHAIRQFILSYFIFAAVFLFAEEESSLPTGSSSVATTEGLPSNLVNQSVCVITGEFVDQSTDAVLAGPEPLVMSRFYSSQDIGGWGGGGWSTNQRDISCVAERFSQHPDKRNTKCLSFILAQSSGARLTYEHDLLTKSELKKRPVEPQLVVPKGLTNGGDEISGKTNIKNQKVFFFGGQEYMQIVSGAGHIRYYHKRAVINAGTIYHQTAEYKINGAAILYEQGDIQFHTKKITCRNLATQQDYSYLEFKQPGKFRDHLTLDLKTSDGKSIRYKFHKHKPHEYPIAYYLEEVTKPHMLSERYEYSERESDKYLNLSHKWIAGRRMLAVDYYHRTTNHVGGAIGSISLEKKDYRLDRVKRLRAPVGEDGELIPIYRFEYHINRKKNSHGEEELLDGKTNVYDAYWHKQTYAFDRNHRLKSHLKYTGTADYAPYSTEGYVWGKEETPYEGFLLGKYLKDKDGRVHHGRYFAYDESGNVTVKALCGRLTGLPCPDIELNESQLPKNNGYECERKFYKYSDDGLNLLKKEEDSNGTVIRYTYKTNPDKSKTDLLASKLTYVNHQISLREFYHYDHNGVMIKKIIDNGTSRDENDLTGFKERHITYYFPRMAMPVGLPERIDEMYLDPYSGTEKLLKRTGCHYSTEGHLLKQDIFDSNGQYVYSQFWDYDAQGHAIRETNALGETITRKYDEYGNLASQQGPGLDYCIANTYDQANRLIRQEEKHTDGKCFVTHNRYNYLNQCIAAVNPYGHETVQEYDDLGRVVAIHLPAIANERGELEHPVIRKEYDVAGNPICVTDAKGRVTRTEYNIRGQPLRITYPDGSQEQFFYRLDGQLWQKVEKNGKRTAYLRDYQGRVLTETVYAANGEILKCRAWDYNAFHMLSFIDEEGLLTTYEYDSAGRLSVLVKGDQRKEHTYDTLGRLVEIKELTGDQPQDFRRYVKAYDLLDRITEERIEAPDGTVLHVDRFAYDCRGNKTLVQSGNQVTLTEYNAHGNPVKIIDALGQMTHVVYNTAFLNEYQQYVLQTTTTDPLGYQIIHTYDTANRLVDEKRLNPFGVLTAHQHIFYDLCGNKVRVIDGVILEGQFQRAIETIYFYTLDNQVEALVEAAWQPEQKITRYSYNEFGQQAAKIKPDGTILFYDYDAEGRMKSMRSSDGTLWYIYDYNRSNQIVKVTDLIHQTATERAYDSLGQVIGEKLGNGLNLAYCFDRAGRARFVILPDQTGIEYVYNALDLKEIHRLKEGKRLYSHIESFHNLSGLTTEAQLVGQNGGIHYQYDALNRCTGIQADALRQSVPAGGYDAAGNLRQYQAQGLDYSFQYDDLYQIKAEAGHVQHTYQNDSLANRRLKDGQVHVLNALNQLIQRGEEHYSYDANGNLIQRKTGTETTSYTYDALDRLVQVSKEGMVIRYAYDAFNRRLTKRQEGRPDQHFFYQGQEEIGAWENGAITELKLLSKGKRSPAVAIEIKQQVYVPIQDLFGHVACLLDLQGQVVERYRYTAFGETQILDSTDQVLSESLTGNPWRYANKRWDGETGFVAFGLRYYDPDLGRWVTADPAGFEDGPNLYAYVHNSPLIYHDQFGLFTELLPIAINFFMNYAMQDPINLPIQSAKCESNKVYPIEDGLLDYWDQTRPIPDSFYHKQSTVFNLNDGFIDPETGKAFNFPEDPNFRVYYSNGINTSKKECIENMIHLSKTLNYNVMGIYSPSFGPVMDLYYYSQNHYRFKAYETVDVMCKEWDNFLKSSLDNRIAMIPHSRGVSYTRNGLAMFPEDLRQRIDVIALAPGGYIDPGLCKSVFHILSKRDFVPLADPIGMIRCHESIIYLNPHSDADWHDHGCQSPTFQDSIRVNFKKVRYQ